MDLSKAFDCLSPSLVKDKLITYGLSNDAVDLIGNYLSNRKQCVKIGEKCSSFLNIIKGVPQGSILGPLIFNIFINDIFYFIDKAKLFNYADDNTLLFSHSDFATLVEILVRESKVLIDWFFRNQMKANPDKFQALAVGEKTSALKSLFRIGKAEIECEETVKLLGVEIDSHLKFDTHISAMCRKASQQINVLKRIGIFLILDLERQFIMPSLCQFFYFCPLIWHFCSKSNTEKLEKINYRALKFVFQDFSSSYEELILKAGTTTLHLSRLRTLALETFKIAYGLSPTYLKEFVCFKVASSYNFRYTNLLEIPRTKSTRHGTNSFRHQPAKLWNSLPEEDRKITSFNYYKQFIKTWNGASCKCSLCK